VIDLHCHVLPGIDDGPDTIEGSVELARAAVTAGTETLVATPHVSVRYPNEHEVIAGLVEQLTQRLRSDGVELRVREGAEIAITRLVDMKADQLATLGLGGGPWLLVEAPFVPSLSGLDGVLADLQERGHHVVLAHPERSAAFQRDPQLLARLVGGGALTSITAGSLTGRFGSTVRRFARQLVEAELVHNVASDAHDCDERTPELAAHLHRSGLSPLLEWLTSEVPGAILRGEETIPARPATAIPLAMRRPRQWWRRGPLRRASLPQ
jgi:protein-tyrosine phosphatase